MFNLKDKIYYPEGLSHQKANINLSEEKEIQYDNEEKKNWHKKIELPQEMDIDMVHRHSNLG